MLKRLIFCLWILLPFSLFAQNEEESSTAHDSLSTEKHQGAFMKAIKKFLNFNDFDTTYISPNRYNYAVLSYALTYLAKVPTGKTNCSAKPS